MKKVSAISILLISLLFSLEVFAANDVAKVIIIKGDVKAKFGEKITTLKKGSWIKEGAIVRTANKSFVKLLFIDKSQMNLGPKSKMVVNKFPRKKAGIITLMKGQLRSKVTKNYMDIKDKKKSKLFIKTKTAAMGVRGTDFQVNYNPENQNTGLITFEGRVAMAQINDSADFRPDPSRLERLVSSDDAVMVTKGQFSAVSKDNTTKATSPVNLNPAQLETLEKNDGSKFKEESAAVEQSKKKFGSILPPGVSGKAFSNDSKEADKQFAKTMGTAAVNVLAVVVEKEKDTIEKSSADGSVNGGFVDTKNIFYIEPPKDAPIDPNTGAPIISSTFGGFDKATGGYTNNHYTLTVTGEFIAKEPEDGRAPASESSDKDGGGLKPLEAPNVLKHFEATTEDTQFDGPEGGLDGNFASGPDGEDFDPEEQIEDLQNDIEQDIENAAEQGSSATTKAKLIFNVN
jgi:hypothetical protein